MGTCAATNQDGTSCSNTAVEGSEYCYVHQPSEEPPAQDASTDDLRFGTMLAGALLVIVVTYALLRFLVGL